MAVQVLAEVANGAAVRQGDADQHLDCRRLASTVGPEQTDNLAFGDREPDAVDGTKRAVQLRKVADFERRLSEHPSRINWRGPHSPIHARRADRPSAVDARPAGSHPGAAFRTPD